MPSTCSLGISSLGKLLFLLLCFYFTKGSISNTHNGVRIKRQVASGSSILTVEWEGIHSGLPDESAIAGFYVEYRPDGVDKWEQHDGIIPYKGANYQYRVRIKDLPSGMLYFVRILVVGRNREILVKTPEIRAQSETVSISCDGRLTEPRNIRIEASGRQSLTISWDSPECGNVEQYVIEVFGRSAYAFFDLQRQSLSENSVTIGNLLPGTVYQVRVRGSGAGKQGPWNSRWVEGTTGGTAPAVSSEIRSIYRSDKQIRVEWEALSDPQLQHYEVMILERSREGEGVQVYRARVPPSQTSYVFKNLKPSTEYVIGVIGFAEHTPRQVYKVDINTAQTGYKLWSEKPKVEEKGSGRFSIDWKAPKEFENKELEGFIIEYRLPNETSWRRYGNQVVYRPGQNEYKVEIGGLSEKVFYAIRVYVLSRRGEVVAKTAEFNVGQAADASCAGFAGVPQNVEVVNAGSNSITYRWKRPSCDESFGPIEGYEYLFWNSQTDSRPQRPTYISRNQVTIDQVKPGQKYTFEVRSRSRGGQSQWSESFKSNSRSQSAKVAVFGPPFGYERHILEDGNIYNLRIVLAPPKSYLVWSPLAKDQGRITRFKLSYKISDTENWERVEDRLESFRCPDGIGNPGDFCHDLSQLRYGVQYTSELLYRLDTGEWSDKGNPLFFILVGYDKPDFPSAPNRLRIVLRAPTIMEVEWLPPLSPVRVDLYKVFAKVLSSSDPRARPGSETVEKRPGNVYSHVLKNLIPNTVYNISVQAGTNQGALGPAAWEVVTTSSGLRGPEIPRPQVSAQGGTVTVSWTVSGDIRNLCCYQIDVRSESEREWRTHGTLVAQNGEVRSYREQVPNLPGNSLHYIRIRALDRSRSSVATSDPARLTTPCQAPTEPPRDISIETEEPSTVFLTWTPPERSTWGCAEVSYVVEGTKNGQPIQFQVPSDPRGFRVEHRISAESGAELRLRVKTVNNGGSSRPSSEYTVRTQREANARAKRQLDVLRVVETAGCNPQNSTCTTEHQFAKGYVKVQLYNQRRAVQSGRIRIKRETYCQKTPEKWLCWDTKSGEVREALVSAPRVSARGSDLVIDWRSQGRGSGIYGYRLEYKNQRGSWTPVGNLVPYQGDGRQYSTTLSNLPVGVVYYIRVLVYDRNQKVVFTSPEGSARTVCESPTQPPLQVRLSAPDSSHVRVDWTGPAQPTWRCNDVSYELEVIEPRSAGRPLTFRRDQTTHVFDASPDVQWKVHLRSRNSAGASPWSREFTIKTPAARELIVGPTLSYRGGIPTLSWRGATGVEDLVKEYRIEYSAQSRPGWRDLPGGSVRSHGWQRPYTYALTTLPEGDTSNVRIKVIDYNNGVQYTSREVEVQMKPPCSKPTRSPALQVSSLGPTQIRVTWKPLSRSEWNCAQIWYILKYSSPIEQGTKNYTAVDSSVVFPSKPYTKWNFQIQSQNPSGSAPWSRLTAGQTLETTPGPVSGLGLQPVGPNSVRISWRQPVNPNGVVVGYEITYQLMSKGLCAESSERPVTVTSHGSSPYYTLEGLNPHSRYKITVAAKTNVIGEPVTEQVTTEAGIPTGQPRSVRAQGPTSTRVMLTWQAPACLETNGEVKEYEYELKGADSWARNEQKKSMTRDARAIIEGLTPYTNYKAKVRAYTNKGAGPWSEEVNVQTKSADKAPAPPVLKVVETEPHSVRVLWQAPYPPQGKIDKYKIDSAIGGTGRWQTNIVDVSFGSKCSSADQYRLTVPADANVHCAVIKGLDAEQLYDLRVSAHIYQKGWGEWSKTESARTAGGPVQVLSVEKAGGTETSLEIRWSVRPADQPRVQGYRVVVSPVDNPNQVQQYTVDGRTSSYKIEGLSANTLYNVTVQARTRSGYHSGKEMTIRTDDDHVPAMAISPRITEQTTNSISLEWNAPIDSQGILSYVVEYRMSRDGAWSRLENEVPHQEGQRFYQSSIVDLQPNTEISVKVRAKGRQNRLGEASPPAQGRTKCDKPSSPPQGVRVDAPSSTEVRVTWSRPGKASWNCDHLEYELWHQAEGQPDTTVPISSEQTQYMLASSPHTTLVIKMRSTNQFGFSEWSEKIRITTKQGAPGSIRNLVLTPMSPNEVRVTWLEPLDPQGDIVGYDVTYRLKYRLSCPDDEPRDVSREWITVYNVKDLDYTITGLLPYSEYEIKVRARTTELGPEETKTVSTDQTPPSAPPLDLQMTYSLERSISFAWDPVECSQRHGHITNYEYEIIGLDAWAKLERQMGNTSDTTVDIGGLIPFTKYMMRLKAYNSAGGGPNTENLEVVTAKADAPLAPQDLVVMQEGTDFFAVNWMPPYPPYGPLDKYKIRYRQLGFTGGQQWIVNEYSYDDPRLVCNSAQHVARLCYNVTQQEPGQQFHVQVAARIEGGNYGPWSQVMVANTLEILPDAPISIMLIDKTDTSLHIGWEPPREMTERISQYRVTVHRMDGEGDAKSFIVQAPQTEYEIQELEPETAYNITVQAGTTRGFGSGVWSRFVTDPFNVPVIGVRPVVTPDGANQLTVEWSGVFDRKDRIDGYIIEYRRSSEPDFQEFGEVVKHNSVKRTYMEKLKNLEPDTIYLVQIKVVDKKGAVSKPSPEAEARTGCAPPKSPPINIRLTAPSPKQVRINWQAPPSYTWLCSEITYKLEYRNGTLGIADTIDLSGSTNQYTFTSKPWTKWTMRLRTENAEGESEWSEEVEIQTPAGRPGPVVKLKCVQLGPQEAKCTWEPPVDPNGPIKEYIITYQLKSKGSCAVQPGPPITKIVRSEKITLEDLEPAATYDVTVRARTEGQQSQEGKPTAPVTVTTEESKPTGPPINVVARSVSKTTATFEWDEPECENRNGEITSYDFEIEALDDWIANGGANIGSVPRELFEATELVPFTRYRYRVKASNSKGNGPFSEWVEIQTDPGAPPAPGDLKEKKAFPTAISVTFLPPRPPHGDIDEYKIRHTAVDRIDWVEVRQDPGQLMCSDESDKERLCYRIGDLVPEKEYRIQVAAHTEDGDWGDWTEPLIVKTVEEVIPTVEGKPVISNIEPDSVVVSWQGVDTRTYKSVDGYVLRYSRGDGNWLQWNDIIEAKSTPNANHREKISGLSPDTTYFFRIHVASKMGKEGPSGPEVSAKTSCGAPLLAPQNVNMSSESFQTVKVKWDPPSKSSWKCGRVNFVIDWRNATHSGFVDVDPDDGNSYIFETQPGTRWVVKMRTQALDGDDKGRTSDWSPETAIVTSGLPDDVFVDLQRRGHDKIQVTWDLPLQGEDWDYGVDIEYKLKQRGSCDPSQHDPVTLYNVRDKQTVIKDLEPYSLYEVIVTPRMPSHLEGTGVQRPKGVQELRTGTTEPSGPPQNLRVEDTTRESISYAWEPPMCHKQNGEITQYEYRVVGLDDWATNTIRQAVTSRKHVLVEDLMRGTRYRMTVKAYTSAGPGPWSDPVDIRTDGSELGPPRELHTVATKHKSVTLTWLPPYPLVSRVKAYRLRYGNRADTDNSIERILSADELSCDGIQAITHENLCFVLSGLSPATTYQVEVQAQAQSGNWGDWSQPYHYFTTKEGPDKPLGGVLKLLSAGADNLKVRWDPPDLIDDSITHYLVSISVAIDRPQNIPIHNVSAHPTEFHFKDLKEITNYNVTVEGIAEDKSKLWYISKLFTTTEKTDGLLSWLSAPTNLHLIEKSDTMLHVTWDPPEILLPAYAELLTHYRVTIAEFYPDTGTLAQPKIFSVPVPGNKIKFQDLDPETIYYITVQGGTNNGYGEILWGAYSTLPPPGKPHILRLRSRTPSSLHMEWTENWGAVKGYMLKAVPLYTEHRLGDLNKVIIRDVGPGRTDFKIRGLYPSTIYNVTLMPKGTTGFVWGAYATLTPGSFVVKNARVCQETDFASSISWEPVDDETATHYRVRYTKEGTNDWVTMDQKSRYHLRCPRDPCNKLCYLLYNYRTKDEKFIIQIQAFVEGTWNRWKTVVNVPSGESEASRKRCCIVPPDYYLDTVGDPGTLMEVDIRPVPNATYVVRYYVFVDERDPPGAVNETLLTDKLTARRNGIPYYVAGSFDTRTLTRERKFPIGDGEVYGGFLNYPLEKGKAYNWGFVTKWNINGRPVYGMLRDKDLIIAGWPWWWLLLLLLLLLLLILLYCCLFWCLASRYRRRTYQRRIVVNGQSPPLLAEQDEKVTQNLIALEKRIDNIRTQIDTKGDGHDSRDGDLDSDSGESSRARRHRRRRKGSDDYYNDRRDYHNRRDYYSTHNSYQMHLLGKGDFEGGYVRGFKDASKVGSATEAKQLMAGEHGHGDFNSGYVQGLRDAGMQGMTTSMHNLAGRTSGGYSSGYMQGFRDGTSGIFGDKITTTLLKRLEEQYPSQDDFRQGYVEGFKEGAGSRTTGGIGGERYEQQNVTQLSDRLQTLEKTKGDEIHSTKIYHVYNQVPEGVGYQSAGQQLAQELEESSSSRRSTLRRHYTPGDYMRYGSDTEGYGSSLRGHRRSLSASALAREDLSPPIYVTTPTLSKTRHTSGGTLGRSNTAQNYDSYNRRYNYRSRSDMGTEYAPRRYASQTLLDGTRPGPTTPTYHRRDALESLQRELDTISKSPNGRYSTGGRGTDLARGYSSDTGYLNDTWRSGRSARSRDDYEYDNYTAQSTRTSRLTADTRGSVVPVAGPKYFPLAPAPKATSPTSPSYGSKVASPSTDSAAQDSTTAAGTSAAQASSLAQAYNLVGMSHSTTTAGTAHGDSSGSERGGTSTAAARAGGGHNWPEELMDIVHEPMPQTLDRMKKYSNSLTQVHPERKSPEAQPLLGGDMKESTSESYSASYKQEYTVGR